MTVEVHHWRDAWRTMSPHERLQFVALMFSESHPGDVLYITPCSFVGWYGWHWMDSCHAD